MNYQNINVMAGSTNPSMVKSYNNKTFAFWERALFQRACSTLDFTLPDEWSGSIRDFFYWSLFKFGYVAVSKNDKFGLFFQPCTLNGFDFYYQPTEAIIANPLYNEQLKIGSDCELIKLTPDYMGIWDIISYYAEKLSVMDNAINISIINSKLAYLIGARNKAAAEALKKAFDKINKGEPAVITDIKLLNDKQDKAEPWQFLQRDSLKNSYITTDLLQDFQTLLNNFDTEIGIPTVPYAKKERMVTSEAESRIVDSTSRVRVWYNTLTSSIDKVNQMYDTDISVKMLFNPDELESDQTEQEDEIDE